ncbi:uncharacterized protein LOC132599604 [Lycium barbarum]|nr:uncharacterized protein LOC132599603 [Lycium barbarum]XP_060168906.1 uncharacterized protein LOC132599604 [Lycium barbarum]
MPLNGNKDLSGDFVVRSTMGKGFDTFRGILRQQGLDNFFRASCFGIYLDLPEDTSARFQMTMVSELLKRKIICDRKDEIWINYCGMPVCFGMKEFAIVTRLRCYPYEPLPTVVLTKPAQTPKADKKAKGSKATNNVYLVNLVGKSYTQKKLLQDLESKTFSKKHKEALCLVWFVHSVLWERDVNYNIPLGLIKLAEDYDAFNNYAWGFQSFSLTVEYLMKDLKPTGKTQNLYGFLWAFMVNFL